MPAKTVNLSLQHVTLMEGGNTVLHRLDTIDPEVLQICQTLLPAGGPIPAVGEGWRVEVAGPTFSVWHHLVPVVACAVGCGETPEWQQLVMVQRTCAPVDKSPPPGRWLAVAILPGLAFRAGEDPECMEWLADFELCMAAALLE